VSKVRYFTQKFRKRNVNVIPLFKNLLGRKQYEHKVWQKFYSQLATHYEQFSAALREHFLGEQLIHLLSLLLVPIARNAFKDEETKNRFFEVAELMGVHILPVNYYSPVPNTAELPKSLWQQRFDDSLVFRLDGQAQLALVRRLAKWSHEMSDTPKTQQSSSEFSWENPAFSAGDAMIYYSMVREFKPKLVLEVGAGYSTLIAIKAALRNEATHVRAIDPYPPKFLRKGLHGLDRLIVKPVQEVSLSEFQHLSSNDILFIDSTHISKIGSDVNYLILNILPYRARGVIVHFHDIFLPWEYPESWVMEKKIFYNEQYILAAFLCFNDAFAILLSNMYLSRIEEYRYELQHAFPHVPAVGGGSPWLRRK
jgi:hypothetical protein